MRNSTFLYILATMCYIGSLFIYFQLLFICGTIFVSSHGITETLEKYFDTQEKDKH